MDRTIRVGEKTYRAIREDSQKNQRTIKVVVGLKYGILEQQIRRSKYDKTKKCQHDGDFKNGICLSCGKDV